VATLDRGALHENRQRRIIWLALVWTNRAMLEMYVVARKELKYYKDMRMDKEEPVHLDRLEEFASSGRGEYRSGCTCIWK